MICIKASYTEYFIQVMQGLGVFPISMLITHKPLKNDWYALPHIPIMFTGYKSSLLNEILSDFKKMFLYPFCCSNDPRMI